LGFGRGKVTRDAIGILRIIQNDLWTYHGELCACFIDWQKALDHVSRTKCVS